MSQISWLLSELEDPFQMFPLQEIAATLNECMTNSNAYLVDRAGWFGVSSKYRTVDEEHTEQVILNLIGTGFVLAQTSIVQAVAIAVRLRKLAGDPPWMPNCKTDIMNTESKIHSETGLSEILLFNAVANYFKHRHQWSSNWVPPHATRRDPESATIEIVSRLGLSAEAANNLDIALRNLGLANISALGESVQAWRERLAQNLRDRLSEHDTTDAEVLC